MHTLTLLILLAIVAGTVTALPVGIDLLIRRRAERDEIVRTGHCTICSAHIARVLRDEETNGWTGFIGE